MGLYNNLKISRALSPVAAGTGNTPYVSQILDTQNYASHMLAIAIGVNTDVNATFTVLLEEGDTATLTDKAAVNDTDMVGTEALASFTYNDDNETRKLQYIGHHRYIRATITPAGNDAGNIYMAAVWIQGNGRKSPQS